MPSEFLDTIWKIVDDTKKSRKLEKIIFLQSKKDRLQEIEAVRKGNDGFEVPYEYEDGSRVDILDRSSQLEIDIESLEKELRNEK